MTNPGMPANSLPPDMGSFMRRIQALERAVKMLQGARTLENASIGAGGLQVDANGAITLNGGDLLVNGGQAQSGDYAAGAAGWRLGSDGNAEFNNLTLRGGIIGDDALANPISVATGYADVNSTDFTNAGADYAIGTIAVPSGFSRALVMCSGTAGDTRTSGGATGWMQIQAWFGRVGDPAGDTAAQFISGTAADGSALSLTSVWSNLITGIPDGSTLRFGVYVTVQSGGWVAGGGNAHTTALAVFLR